MWGFLFVVAFVLASLCCLLAMLSIATSSHQGQIITHPPVVRNDEHEKAIIPTNTIIIEQAIISAALLGNRKHLQALQHPLAYCLRRSLRS